MLARSPARRPSIAVAAQQKHEGLFQAGLNHAAKRRAIHVDGRLASRIVVTELRGLRAAEQGRNTAEPSVEASREPS
jgi:hypothetical protein